MSETKLTMFDAVKDDINRGLRRYKSIKDHEREPVSLLLDRDAFLVLFPLQQPQPGTGRRGITLI